MFIRQVQNITADCNLIFSLSNAPLVRANSFNQNIIEYSSHCNLFSKTLADKNTLFLLVFADETVTDFIGQIRFKRESETSTECVISLSITEKFRGNHIAVEFVKLEIEALKKSWYNANTIVAEVKDENTASNGLYVKEGFEWGVKVNNYRLNISEILGYRCGVVFANCTSFVPKAA